MNRIKWIIVCALLPMVAGSQSCPCGNNINLFHNGDFETDALSPSSTEMSEWAVNCNEIFGCYDIVSSASDVGGQFNGAPHGGSKFMFVDGQDSSPGDTPQLVWAQNVDCLIPGENYQFKFWLLGCSLFGDIFVLDASVIVNGNQTILNTNTLINTMMPNPNTPLAWQQYSFNWTATSSQATFALHQISFSSNGFDFGLDDIRLIGDSDAILEVNSTTTSVTCSGDDGSIMVTPQNGTSPFTYQITNASGLVQTSTQVAALFVPVEVAGDFQIEITDSGNCSTEVNVQVNQEAILEASLDQLQPTCSDSGWVELTPLTGTPPFQLTVNNVIQPQLNWPISEDIYTFSLMDANGCHYDSTLQFEIQNNVIADFSSEILNQTISVENQSQHADTYAWYLSDTLISNQLNPENFDLVPGIYSLELTATDTVTGCTNTITKSIEIPDIFSIYIPNCITANNDGINDELFVIADDSQLAQFQLSIFNRWGDAVFYTEDIHTPWYANHKKGNYYVQDGVYPYFLKYTRKSDPTVYELRGHITVLR